MDMAETKAQKAEKEYKRTRTTYLQKRVQQTTEQLRSAGVSKKKRDTLNDQLKRQKDNLSKIKSKSHSEETTMSNNDQLKRQKANLSKIKSKSHYEETTMSKLSEQYREHTQSETAAKKPAAKGGSLSDTLKSFWNGDEDAAALLYNNGIDAKDLLQAKHRGKSLTDLVNDLKGEAEDFNPAAKPTANSKKFLNLYKKYAADPAPEKTSVFEAVKRALKNQGGTSELIANGVDAKGLEKHIKAGSTPKDVMAWVEKTAKGITKSYDRRKKPSLEQKKSIERLVHGESEITSSPKTAKAVKKDILLASKGDAGAAHRLAQNQVDITDALSALDKGEDIDSVVHDVVSYLGRIKTDYDPNAKASPKMRDIAKRQMALFDHNITNKPVANTATPATKAVPTKKAAPAANTDANGKRYTKRGVTTMLKELREAQEKGRKGSSAAKKRDEDIKRLSKILKTLSSVEGATLKASDMYKLDTIAASLDS